MQHRKREIGKKAWERRESTGKTRKTPTSGKPEKDAAGAID